MSKTTVSGPYSIVSPSSLVSNLRDNKRDISGEIEELNGMFGKNANLNIVFKDQIFLLDTIETDNTQRAIVTMARSIKHQIKKAQSLANRVKSGGRVAKDEWPALEVYINSPGGDLYAYQTILGLLTMAKMNRVTVKTIVFGWAASAASMLAVHGSPGHRVMYKDALHMVHFGTFDQYITKETEIEKSARELERYKRIGRDTYLLNTRIGDKKLKALMEDEMGYLGALECLELGFCDMVIGREKIIKLNSAARAARRRQLIKD
ncbi:MAG: ATP-dependent Clp protease proteolytic subunit [Rickettsiales bacterium]|jgi:ATP-dependent protease ClpP protease subunit|nr:ATP-dependent Clp protease proteolytic subunit [Rickettsiales bacterium]